MCFLAEMGFVLKNLYHLLTVMVLLPALCHSEDTFTCSRATYYGSPDCLGTPSGACGFGEYGRTVNDANVAGVSRLWRNGTGCGGCYQVRCKVPQLCTDDGVNVVVTDYGEGDHTDFVLSPQAYARMARPQASKELFAHGVVDVEFRRMPCRYPGHNVMIKVHENSRFPGYLAIFFLYQAGQNDILAVDIWLEDRKEWSGMRRAYGGVWDYPNPPRGVINLRFKVSGSVGLTWVEAKNSIPSHWQPGVAYNAGLQLY